MNLQQFASELNDLGRQTGIDVRLEVLLAELVEQGLDPRRDVLIYPQGLFARDYRPDVAIGANKAGVWAGLPSSFEGEKLRDDLPQPTPVLNISVYRDGLYDYLPEGLFHQPTTDDDRQFEREIDEQNQRERIARRFFRPIEQEFYLLGLWLEAEERAWLLNEDNLNRPQQGDWLRNIWGLPADRVIKTPGVAGQKATYRRSPLLDTRQLCNLMHLLPIAHRLAGNLGLVQQIFELVLGMPVELEPISPLLVPMALDQQVYSASAQMGQVTMGNFSLTGNYQNTMPTLAIKLGPLTREQVVGFLPEADQQAGRHQAVLDLLIGYFLSAETETVVYLLTDESQRHLTLHDTGAAPILGWDSYL